MAWRRISIGVVLVLLAGAVFAAALPDQSTLTIMNGTELVGSGTYVGGNLILDVSSTFTGDATLTVTTRGGDTLAYDATINPDGTVTLTGTDTLLQNINPSIAARGGAATISLVDEGTLTLPTLPDGVPGPNPRSTMGINNAAAAASVGVSHASDHAGAGSGNGKP